MSVIAREIQNLLNQELPVSWYGYSNSTSKYYIRSNESEYTLEIPMVGIVKENLAIDVQDSTLTVSAKADKKVSQYAKDFKELKLVSINPAEIIGANELWIYNTKTRKLGKYVAAPHSQLGVKGTSIENFDTDRSVCKTLRKPAEKLKEFSKAGKIALRKFMDDIKATETKLNGRINLDILLLKVA